MRDGLGRLLQGEELSAEDGAFYRRLLTDRNANWAEQIAALTQQGGTHFIAVGAAHLAGKNSLQQMLQDRGFKVAFVTDGRIQYLADSTHALAGQTVDLPEWSNRIGAHR